jgi:hypothetical protein
MKAKQLIAAVTAIVATSTVFAHDWVEFNEFHSTKTRAELVAELQQAKADGSYALAAQDNQPGNGIAR